MVHATFNFFQKLGTVLETTWGWLVALALIIAEYFAGHGFVVFLVIATTLMDAVWGIAVSVHQNKFALSELARLTIGKLAVYGGALFVFVGLDHFIESTITASVVGAAIVLVEFWSSSASMLILFPDFLWLSLMRKALIGEISRKLHITEDEVKEMMHQHDEDRKRIDAERAAKRKARKEAEEKKKSEPQNK